jgi:hypothetical protein
MGMGGYEVMTDITVNVRLPRFYCVLPRINIAQLLLMFWH